ncbi:MAG TPA: hypothetical protein VFJ17_09015 [Mycobacteriales bacterium]|jgi:hypothetical protein|nr:hypothetical protein [Mycobacteriales bacterium]
MTNATATAPATTGRSLPSAETLFGIGIVLGAIVIFAGNYNVKKGENGGLGPAIVTAVILVAVAALLWFVVRPRVQNINRTVIILSVLAIVSIVAFWAGVTPILAAAALAVGAGAAQLSKAARVLQVIAVVVALITVVGTLAQSHLF